ncbi:hypothetical protein Csa_023551, partial [Cucumis sativus]
PHPPLAQFVASTVSKNRGFHSPSVCKPSPSVEKWSSDSVWRLQCLKLVSRGQLARPVAVSTAAPGVGTPSGTSLFERFLYEGVFSLQPKVTIRIGRFSDGLL